MVVESANFLGSAANLLRPSRLLDRFLGVHLLRKLGAVYCRRATRLGLSHTGFPTGTSSDLFAGGAFEEFVDEGLIGLGLLGGHAAELGKEARGNTDGDQMLGVTGNGAAYSVR